ncbi:MFS family permease [Actinopolyspora biskrensis]|uniref:MFS family permease n=1 Tax=Actinopolyspora biskrensis TaxID=1470178 RepID=A0A852YV20_9ACTN|nr:MFS transporter [Actinopolyspora biskrensis]NYH77582.1 MFS family permease [Actinopolyspora biskrensis]
MVDHGSTGTVTAGWGRGLWILLFVLSGNMVLDAIEVSVVLLALPEISADLGLTLWTVQWLMSGFSLGFAAMLMLGPVLTARWGRRPIYLGAMVLFAVASVVGGMADSVSVLIITRIVKGICAALTAPVGLALISTTFPEGAQRNKAVSIYSLFGAAGFTIGLLLSGLFSETNWRWNFLFPAPVALVLLLLGAWVIPASAAPKPPRVTSAVLRNGSLVRAALGASTLNGTYIGLLLLVTVQSKEWFDWHPWQTAVALLPACAPLAVTVPFTGRLVQRFGTTSLITTGAFSAFAGVVLYLWQPEPESYTTGLLPVLLLVEAGFVLSFTALNMQSTSTIEPASRSVAVPFYQTAVQLGSVVMLPSVAALLTLFQGYRPALLVISVFGAFGVCVALAGFRKTSLERKIQI